MVVDDEYDIANLIKRALHLNGLKVSFFTDPFKALEDYKTNCKNCSVILSDIRMPGMNGYEFVKKAKEFDKLVKVILMTAFEIEDKEFHNILPDIKVDAFLQKPFTLRELRDIVQKNSVAAAIQ